MSPTERQRSAWIGLGIALATISGLYNVISGIAAIAKNDVTKNQAKVLFDIDLTAWGWAWLVLGIVQLITAYLIMQRSRTGLWIGLFWAVLSATMTVVIIFVYPLWAILILTLQIGIIAALLNEVTSVDS